MRTALQIALRDINRLIAQESYNSNCKCELEQILAELQKIVAEVGLMGDELDQALIEIASLQARIAALEAENITINNTLVSLQTQINNLEPGGDLLPAVLKLQRQMEQTNFIVTDFDTVYDALQMVSFMNGVLRFPPGSYDLFESWTVPKDVILVFDAGATLHGDSSITLHFDGQLQASPTQIFEGEINITGLDEFELAWVAADYIGVESYDVTYTLQRTLNNINPDGVVKWVNGTLYTNASTQVTLERGISIRGYSRDMSKLCMAGNFTDVFLVASDNVKISEMTFYRKNVLEIGSIGGSVITVEGSFFKLDNVIIDGAFRAVDIIGGTGARLNNFTLMNSTSAGVSIIHAKETLLNEFTINAPLYYVETEVTGGTDIVKGEIVTMQKGVDVYGEYEVVYVNPGYPSEITLKMLSGYYDFATTLHTGTKEARIINQSYCHVRGGLSIRDGSSGVSVTNGYIRGGLTSLVAACTSFPPANPVAYSVIPTALRFTDALFDTSVNGSSVNGCIDVNFEGCTFGRSTKNGLNLHAGESITINGSTFGKNVWNGILVYKESSLVSIVGCKAIGNNVFGLSPVNGNGSGMVMLGDASNFVITNNVIGSYYYGDQQNYGIYVSDGTSDFFIISNNLSGINSNVVAGVHIGTITGTSTYVANNL